MKQCISGLILFLLCAIAYGSESTRSFLESQTRYWGIHEKITSADIDKLADLKQKADSPGLSIEDRTKAYTDLFQFVQKLRGFPEGKTPASMAANYWSEEGMNAAPGTARSKPSQLGGVTKRGSGEIPMILIPDLGADSTVFDSFMHRNQSLYTFYAITLPGFGGTPPPTKPAILDFGATNWWNNAEAAVLALVQKEKIKQPVVLGHQAGSYLAMRLALHHPEHFRGAVVLNGLLYAPLPGVAGSLPLKERAAMVNSWTPIEMFPNAVTSRYRSFLVPYAAWFCKDKKRQEELLDLAAQSGPDTWWNYYAEISTTDLSTEMKTLRIAMLVLPSIYDSALPGYETYKTTLAQWNPLEQSVSSLPITLMRMEECRGYATEDQPEKLDEAVRNWSKKLPR